MEKCSANGVDSKRVKDNRNLKIMSVALRYRGEHFGLFSSTKFYLSHLRVSENVLFASESERKKYGVETYKGSACVLSFHLPWS